MDLPRWRLALTDTADIAGIVEKVPENMENAEIAGIVKNGDFF